MVLPISGPFTKTYTYPYATEFRRGWRQKRPYNIPLEYKYYMYEGKTWGYDAYSSPGGSVTYPFGPIKQNSFGPKSFAKYDNYMASAINDCYSKFKGEMSPSAGWAENIAQAGKTRELLVNSCLTIAEVVGSIKRGRFDRAAIALNLLREPKGVSRRKSVAQNFLAFEYGVKPTIKDIQESIQLITGDVPSLPIRVRSRNSMSEPVNTRTRQPNGSFTINIVTRECWLRVQMGGTVQVTNPNLFLANQLGLLDLALPWKLVPFSFIVDWFVNVEQMISSCTDWFGVDLHDAYITKSAKATMTSFSKAFTISGGGLYFTDSVTRADGEGVECDRVLGFSGPTLQMKPFKGFSMERGAQAISLVLSVFGK